MTLSRPHRISFGKWLVVAITAFGTACSTPLSRTTPERDAFSLLAGEWGTNQTDTCDTNPHVISFSEDRHMATFEFQHPVDNDGNNKIVFLVRGSGRSWIYVQNVKETRRMWNGEPQVYKLQLTPDLNGYRWYEYPYGDKSLLFGIRCKSFDTEASEEDAQPRNRTRPYP
jgi:hypothetical protein